MAFGRKLFFATLFISLLMETDSNPKDPWSGFAWYFHADLKSWLPQISLALNPVEIAVIIVALAWVLRGRYDRQFRFERGLLFWPIIGLLGTLAFGLLWGIAHGGDNFTVALWELRALALCAIAYFLVGILFTRRRDLDILTWVILISSLLLGIECIVRYVFFLPGHIVGDLSYDHEDATLLASALVLSCAMLLLGSTRRQKLFVLVSAPIELIGMMLTHRRAGEAALVVGLVFLAVILFRVNRPVFLRVVPITALLFGIYLGVYWNCTSGTLCQPARAINSQINPDPRDAASNLYRDQEKQDLTLNIEVHPITGLGFGQPFVFYVPLPDLSFWPFWHYTSHNAILWVWVKTGMFGFILFWWLLGSGVYRGSRLIQALSAAGDYKGRALLAAGVILIVMQMTVSYVDLGLTSDRSMLLLGVMFGIIGHLPAILRRSTGNEQASVRPLKAEPSRVLKTETPEMQVGALARVLVMPVEPETPRRPATTRTGASSRWGQSNNTHPARTQTPSRWGQDDGTATRSRSSQRLSTSGQTISRSRDLHDQSG